MHTRLQDPVFMKMVEQYDAGQRTQFLEKTKSERIEAELAAIDCDELVQRYSQYEEQRPLGEKLYRDEDDFCSHWGGMLKRENFPQYLAFKRKRLHDPSYRPPMESGY